MRVGINYVARSTERMRYFANDSSRDTVVLDPRPMAIRNAREIGATLDGEGFALVPHRSVVADFADAAEVKRVHPEEIAELVRHVSGADEVVVTGAGVLRFAERSTLSGALDNSKPARFAHVDVSDATASQFGARSLPVGSGKPRRIAHYNVWRALSRRRRMCRSLCVTRVAWQRRICCRRTPCSTRMVRWSGRSRDWSSRIPWRIAGIGSRISHATRRSCSRPMTAIPTARIRCRMLRSTIPNVRPMRYLAPRSRCARSPIGSRVPGRYAPASEFSVRIGRIIR